MTPDEAKQHLQPYQCHKQVRAAKILEVRGTTHGFPNSLLIWNGDGTRVDLDESWMAKHNPEPGGYLVMYEDGYLSYSPPEAFEDGYAKIEESREGVSLGQIAWGAYRNVVHGVDYDGEWKYLHENARAGWEAAARKLYDLGSIESFEDDEPPVETEEDRKAEEALAAVADVADVADVAAKPKPGFDWEMLIGFAFILALAVGITWLIADYVDLRQRVEKQTQRVDAVTRYLTARGYWRETYTDHAGQRCAVIGGEKDTATAFEVYEICAPPRK